MTRLRPGGIVLTVGLVVAIVVAASLAARSSIRVEDLEVGECFVYDRAETITSVDVLDCTDALDAVGDPTGAVAALVVWRGRLADDTSDRMAALDAACEEARESSPVVVPLLFERPTEDGFDGLCLALGR